MRVDDRLRKCLCGLTMECVLPAAPNVLPYLICFQCGSTRDWGEIEKNSFVDKNHWIDIDSSSPKKNENVIVDTEYGVYLAKYVGKSKAEKSVDVFVFLSESLEGIISGVKHWMRIPMPPRVNKKLEQACVESVTGLWREIY